MAPITPTSPSNLAEPFGLGRNPLFTHWDNVHAQERLLREKFGVTRLALVYGWSMGRPAGAALGGFVPRPRSPHLRGVHVGAHQPAQQGVPGRHPRDAGSASGLPRSRTIWCAPGKAISCAATEKTSCR